METILTKKEEEYEIVQAASLISAGQLYKFRDYMRPIVNKEQLTALDIHIESRTRCGLMTVPDRDPESVWKFLRTKVCEVLQIPDGGDALKTRKKYYVLSRKIVYAALRKECDISLNEIAAYYGQDHSTAVYSIKKIVDYLITDKHYRHLILCFAQLISEYGYKNFEMWCDSVIKGRAVVYKIGQRVYRNGSNEKYYFLDEVSDGYVCSKQKTLDRISRIPTSMKVIIPYNEIDHG